MSFAEVGSPSVHGTGESDFESMHGVEDLAIFNPDQVAGRDAACCFSCDRLFNVFSADRRPVLVFLCALGFAIDSFAWREEGDTVLREVEAEVDGDRVG